MGPYACTRKPKTFTNAFGILCPPLYYNADDSSRLQNDCDGDDDDSGVGGVVVSICLIYIALFPISLFK